MLKQDADFVVTTAKDYVKLQPLWGTGELVQLIYGIKVIQGEDALSEHLNRADGRTAQ
jgi:hypothetical protein